MGGWSLETRLLELRAVRQEKEQGVDVLKSGKWRWREGFRIMTTLLLSLLLPLSFLLLARLSAARHFSTTSSTTSPSIPDHHHLPLLIFLIICDSTPTVLYLLVSLITVAAFVHAFTPINVACHNNRRRQQSSAGLQFHVNSDDDRDHHRVFFGSRPHLYTAWIILCTLQICVGLGIEGSISTTKTTMINSSSNSSSRRWLIMGRVIFLVGLHETMHFWSKSVVKPVVDDTVMGYYYCMQVEEEEERWIERVGIAMSIGGLWWWKLRDEIDALQVGFGGILADFVGWWLYYLTVTIGIIRLIRAAIWVPAGFVLLSTRASSGAGGFLLRPPHAHSVSHDIAHQLSIAMTTPSKC